MIKLEDINLGFGNKKLFTNFNLHIKEGQFLIIIGDNGAGKSSIFNLVSGFVRPNSGKIIIGGLDVTSKSEHIRAKDIAYVFQDPKLGTNTKMTVRENLSLAINKCNSLSLKKAVNPKNDPLFVSMLKDLGMGLENLLNQEVGTLSGGQRQALSLIMATRSNPKILLLDEHTAALDLASAKLILDKTNEIILKNNLTSIMITHNVSSALKYGNRLIFMREGRIEKDISHREKIKMTLDDIAKLFD